MMNVNHEAAFIDLLLSGFDLERVQLLFPLHSLTIEVMNKIAGNK
jgi:hypothetical protein